MYPVTHMAIAVGSVWTGESVWHRLGRRRSSANGVVHAIDYRIVALGALLPDAIDKPLWRITGHDIGSDHTIGHTLVFSLAILAAGALFARRGESRLLWLGLGAVSHPLVDPVVVYPSTLLWPLFGVSFGPTPGIPSPYLRVLDAVLAGIGAVGLMRSNRFRGHTKRFLTTGELAGGDSTYGRRQPVAQGRGPEPQG
ncbi:MAG TPA: metal-dependent hydrolase [Dehalococcoidia bacterium]|nr:metal-dependent hydrolase [Dehalococcoidia bacterium]